MNKKRIAIWMHGGIGNGNFSQGYPMLEKLVYKLADDFDIVVYSHTPPNEGFQTNRIVLKFPSRKITSGKLRWVVLSWFFLGDQIRKRFDTLLAFWGYPTGVFVVLWGKILACRTEISVLGADSASIPSINYGVFNNRRQRQLAKWSYENASGILTISDFQKKKLQGFGVRKKMTTIPWGADKEMYRFREKQIEYPIQFIHVAHINPVKDQPTLLRAFQLISQAVPSRLKMFGLDTMDRAMHKLADELGIQHMIEFIDMVPYHEMPAHFANAHIMLHTSLSEAQCMALTEAAATGVLMAGTNVGILHDLGESCGIVVDVGDYQSLAEKVIAIIKNRSEWKRRVDNARAWSSSHDLDWTVKTLRDYLG
jgi:glycosyltransferase involved in cell wall biosynthesis